VQVIPDTIDFSQYLAGPDEAASIRPAVDWLDEVIGRFERPPTQTGATLPWSKTKNCVRLRRGELTIFAGRSGEGQSLAEGQIISGLMAQGEKVAIASMEMHWCDDGPHVPPGTRHRPPRH